MKGVVVGYLVSSANGSNRSFCIVNDEKHPLKQQLREVVVTYLEDICESLQLKTFSTENAEKTQLTTALEHYMVRQDGGSEGCESKCTWD